jgi:hypothetical protein
MRIGLSFTLVLALWAPAARAGGMLDPKALARYDLSYVTCESRFPPMQGHRDEAYLNLWHVRPDAAALSRIETLRRVATYKSERQRLLKTAAQSPSPSPAATNTLERECQGLWAENERAKQRQK